MSNIELPQKSARNPATQKAHAHQTMWQITVPLVIGVLVAIAFAVLAGLAGSAEASRWADISLIFLIIPAMLATLLFVVLFAALNYGLLRVLKYLPPLARQVQEVFSQVERRVRTGADMAAEPILRIQSVLAAARSLRQQLRFKR
jgi:predicted PurR-regulated permease PerM